MAFCRLASSYSNSSLIKDTLKKFILIMKNYLDAIFIERNVVPDKVEYSALLSICLNLVQFYAFHKMNPLFGFNCLSSIADHLVYSLSVWI